ncbi:hypothetical protein VTL71DRAFT_478, partial [Oculimacula yallundae]
MMERGSQATNICNLARSLRILLYQTSTSSLFSSRLPRLLLLGIASTSNSITYHSHRLRGIPQKYKDT